MKDNRIKFSQANIKALATPTDGKQKTYYDTVSRGLCVILSPSGKKSFYVLRKFRGRVERVLLGRFPDTGVSASRRRAGEINTQFDAGHNPNKDRRAHRGELALGELHEVYMTRHCHVHNRRPEKQAYHFRLYLDHWTNRKLSTITRADVAAWHARLGDQNGQRSANVALALLRAMFNRALDWELFTGTNPTAGTRKFREIARERFLLPDELRRFALALRKIENTNTRDFFLLLLLTGVRKTNLLTMRWQNLNLADGVWHIPDTKTGEPQLLPLSPQAMQVLESRVQQPADEPSDYVFPGPGVDGHLTDPKRAWSTLCKTAQLNDFHMHDLRRTHASYMAATGANQFVISKALGHKSIETTAIYARLSLDPVRAAATQATDAMREATGGLL